MRAQSSAKQIQPPRPTPAHFENVESTVRLSLVGPSLSPSHWRWNMFSLSSLHWTLRLDPLLGGAGDANGKVRISLPNSLEGNHGATSPSQSSNVFWRELFSSRSSIA